LTGSTGLNVNATGHPSHGGDHGDMEKKLDQILRDVEAIRRSLRD